MTVVTTEIATPLGRMIAAATEKGVCMLEFADSKKLDLELRQLSEAFGSSQSGPRTSRTPLTEGPGGHLDALEKQLAEYFNGRRRSFDVPLDLAGTEFQKQVWLSLLRIPYGETVSYAAEAAMVGRPSAVRAVAGANGRNKVSIILPCHRVIGSDGSLTGYGGGMERKKWLLELEKKNI